MNNEPNDIVKAYENESEVKSKNVSVKRAEVTRESIVSDQWDVKGKRPGQHYAWARKDDNAEMNMMAQRGYEPARGNERIMGNPFEASKDANGKLKVRGSRILMCCPEELVTARRKERASRYVSAKKDGQSRARSFQRQGVSVTSESEEETKRESIAE